MDYMIEKCTELGVSNFYLIQTRHSNYFSKNISRFEKITRQAIKQSLQYYLPNISVYSSLEQFIQKVSAYSYKIAAISADKSSLFSNLFDFRRDSGQSFLYIVGPEGGFSQDETVLLTENGFSSVSLGMNRLRTETAAITGISLIEQYIQQ
jgi:16S rRNA (uracil1498-N3)-methyltransferase